jgi:dihydroorotate dehydrogenase (fumarate)
MDMTTRYMGLKLPTPLVVASSGLTGKLDSLKRMADSGAGAIVLKSLFEEQLSAVLKQTSEDAWMSAHAEAYDYVANFQMELEPDTYLRLIAEARKSLSIPIIASLNCVSPRWWAEYARRIEAAGANALELNVALLPSESRRSGQQIEEIYYRILSEVRAVVKLPLAVKIGTQFSSLANFASQLQFRGANALVLFNRFYQIDIDVEKMRVVPTARPSRGGDANLALRWISLLAGRIDCDLAASGGVSRGTDAVKMLLAGAAVVQVCTALYQNGIEHLKQMVEEIDGWMKRHEQSTIAGFRGQLRQLGSDQPEQYERLQYIKALVGME